MAPTATASLLVDSATLAPPGQAQSAYLVVDPVLCGTPSLVLAAYATRLIYAGPSYVARLDEVSEIVVVVASGALDVIAGSTITEITSGQTVYVGLFEDALEQRVSLPMPAGTLSELYVASTTAPGAGQSATFTVVKTGNLQSMAVAISGTGTAAATTSNPVTFVAGDRLALRLVTSGAAASAIYRFAVKYQMAV